MVVAEVTEGTWKGWYSVTFPTPAVLDYLRGTVPNVYRYQADSIWYVHAKHVGPILGKSKVDDPYEVLYLRSNAPQAIVKAVWRELAKTLHPDVGGSPEAFQRAKNAYDTIVKR